MNDSRPIDTATPRLPLAIVLPVFNEADAIAAVLSEWFTAVEQETSRFLLIAINDGSTDNTLAILNQFKEQWPDRVTVIDQPNSGHGISCRAGYEAALQTGAEWILQIDSDGQCDPRYFHQFWSVRDHADVVFGLRVARFDGALRRAISTACRALTFLVTGSDLKDANVPYRLMSRKALERALPRVPRDFQIHNVALTLALKRD
ncbi:MAG: glycosyltransferase family 2 protein, partial [Verrucomicrobiota bacterium]|nr:glycosyltransferase family 2 protein [Verrucomicrobiota bacterium]